MSLSAPHEIRHGYEFEGMIHVEEEAKCAFEVFDKLEVFRFFFENRDWRVQLIQEQGI